MRKPFIKWAGGKRWLTNQLDPYFQDFGGTYVEPFLGSGAIFFNYLPKRSILSDKNEELISTYKVMRDYPKQLFEELISLSSLHSKENYYQVRSFVPNSIVKSAARFLYLNRTCWNGLYRVNRQGQFNVPIGTKETIVFPDENFEDISNDLKSAEIFHSDFEEQIDKAIKGDLIFADPPYTVSHNNNGFIKYNESIFSWSDQVRLHQALKRAQTRGCRVIATNAAHSDLVNLYSSDFNLMEIKRHTIISSNSKGRKVTSELFITNF